MSEKIYFENYDRKIEKINKVLASYGISDLEDSAEICREKGFDPYQIAKDIQPICFDDACWAYVAGAAIAIKKGCSEAAEAAEAIGEGLQAFCLPGSVAEDRKVGLGHGNLAAMLLREETECFAFGARIFCRCRGSHRNSQVSQQDKKETSAHYPQRFRKGCSSDYFQNQRLYLC